MTSSTSIINTEFRDIPSEKLRRSQSSLEGDAPRLSDKDEDSCTQDIIDEIEPAETDQQTNAKSRGHAAASARESYVKIPTIAQIRRNRARQNRESKPKCPAIDESRDKNNGNSVGELETKPKQKKQQLRPSCIVEDVKATEEEEEDADEDESEGLVEEENQNHLEQMLKTLSTIMGNVDVPPMTTKTKRSKAPRSRGQPARGDKNVDSVATSLKNQLEATHSKVWRYISLNQKNAREHFCTGEIIELYKDISSSFPGQPLRPLWTTFKGDTVLLCHQLSEFSEGLPKYPNKYATAWFPDAAKWNFELLGRVIIVPMNQTKYDVFKTTVKQMLKSKVVDNPISSEKQ